MNDERKKQIDDLLEGFQLNTKEDEPDDRDYPCSAILANNEEKKEFLDNYVVPYYRHWFDENFEPIEEVIEKEIKNQGKIGSCVGQSGAYQKQAQEKIKCSARFLYAHCKNIDGNTNQGTGLRISQKVLRDTGISSESLYPEKNQLSHEEYIDLNKIPTEATEDAKNHKSKSSFGVNRPHFGIEEYQEVLVRTETPIQTGMQWYREDNYIEKFVGEPQGDNVGGHSFSVIGWVTIEEKKYLIAINSWGVYWGYKGLFYFGKEALYRLYYGWVTVDIERTLAELLIAYNGKAIMTQDDVRVYVVSGGQKHLFLDEFVFWSKGFVFSEIEEIAKEEMEIIPQGDDSQFDYDKKWEIKVVKDMLGMLENNPARAKELSQKYF